MLYNCNIWTKKNNIIKKYCSVAQKNNKKFYSKMLKKLLLTIFLLYCKYIKEEL